MADESTITPMNANWLRVDLQQCESVAPGTPKTKQSSGKESNILRVSFGKHREAETDSSFTMLSKANEFSVAAI
jgi:hypothetical protein